jgi:hypothetical protein
MPENMAGSTVSPRRFLFLLRRLWAETFSGLRSRKGSTFPRTAGRRSNFPTCQCETKNMAGPTGFEPATSRLTIWRPKPG